MGFKTGDLYWMIKDLLAAGKEWERIIGEPQKEEGLSSYDTFAVSMFEEAEKNLAYYIGRDGNA